MLKKASLVLAIIFPVLLVLGSLSATKAGKGRSLGEKADPLSAGASGPIPIPGDLSLAPDFGKTPLYFMANQGQADERALFYSRTSRYTLWVTNEGLIFDSTYSGDKPALYEAQSERAAPRLAFLNSNRNPKITALEPSEHKVNYFIGNDPANWKKDIPTSLAVLYEEVYHGIDLKIYGREDQIEYDWIVKPGSCYQDIRFEYRDAERADIDREGNLAIETKFGRLVNKKPSSRQRIDGETIVIGSRYVALGNRVFGYAVEDHRPDRELVIDPLILVYSTYLGGSNYDHGYAIAVDKNGAAYVTGETQSTNFPLKGPYQKTLKNGVFNDAFVVKFAPAGNALVYSTYLGGSLGEHGKGIAVDGAGAVYLTGWTGSQDFPLQNPFQSAPKKNPEAFISKLSPLGNALVYSSYLGGGDSEWATAVAVDASGAAYLTGWTKSADFPVLNPFKAAWGGNEDAFVSKIAPAGNALVYSTYLGGLQNEEGNGIAVDSAGAAYLTGWTWSSNFPLQNPYQSALKYEDAFVAKLAPAGNALVYSTYLGGWWFDSAHGIAVDSAGAAYVTGWTESNDFPLMNPYKSVFNIGTYKEAFLTKLSPQGNSLSYSTYLGGGNSDQANKVAVNSSGAAYVTGFTSSTDFPSKNSLKGQDGRIFLTKFMPQGNALAYSTRFGDSANERGEAVAVDGNGAAYIVGWTDSKTFPTQNPFQKEIKGKRDAIVAKFLEGEITVTVPNGGEAWKVSGTYNIKWKYSGSLGKRVAIELFKGSQSVKTICASALIGTNGKGSYKWKIPSNLAVGANYKIRITSRDVPACWDGSDKYFKITGTT